MRLDNDFYYTAIRIDSVAIEGDGMFPLSATDIAGTVLRIAIGAARDIPLNVTERRAYRARARARAQKLNKVT